MYISIIIPVYNCEKYIRQCVESCFNQDIDQNEYEIIIVNDGSTDNSLSIIKELCAQCRIIQFISQEHTGASAARNAGLKAAKGDFIWFIDGDDFIRKNSLREIKETIENTDCDRIILGVYQGDSQVLRKIDANNVYPNMPSNHLWSSVFRRKTIQDIGIEFVDGLTHFEDMLFLHDFENHSKPAELIQTVSYYHRKHDGSITDLSCIRNLINLLNSLLSVNRIILDRVIDCETVVPSDYVFWKANAFSYLYKYIPILPINQRKEWVKKGWNEPMFDSVFRDDGIYPENLAKRITRDSNKLRKAYKFYGSSIGIRLLSLGKLYYYSGFRRTIRGYKRRIIKRVKT